MMLVNGAPADSIPVTDRGLAYGDGVFRTLLAVNGQPLHWPKHEAKLRGDCAVLDLPALPAGTLLQEVRTVSAGHTRAVVKILVTRGSGPRGYALPIPCVPTRMVTADAHTPSLHHERGIRVHVCRLRLAHQPALAGVKHLNRLENVLAHAEWNDTAIAEGLLLDVADYVIGGTMSNLFIVESGVLVTPDLSRCGVAGVTRARVIDIAAKSGIVCRVEHLPWQRVLDADELFVVNSVIGLWPVTQMSARHWRIGEVTAQILQMLKEDDAALV
jgi:4-amino-4-deoxychorismate lyase